MSRQLVERGEACLVCRLPRPRARWLAGWGEACLLCLTPAPSPTCGWLAGRGENFTSTPSVYSSSLPWLERLSYCLEYMSFSRFQYELLVHTPNTDVYRRILECRFTHFAPYVVNNETDIIVRTLPCPRGGRATIHSVSYSQNDIYCSWRKYALEAIIKWLLL